MASVSVVRELPPDRLTYRAITPTGRVYRWAEDAVLAQDSPADHRHSSVMPGGYDTFEISLPRDPSIDYGDLKRLTTVEIESAGGMEVGEYRLQEIPRASGERLQVTPRAVGWKQHLEDDKGAFAIYVDRDLSRWGPPTNPRKLARIAAGEGYGTDGPSLSSEDGNPALELSMSRISQNVIAEAYYDGQGVPISKLSGSMSSSGIASDWEVTAQLQRDEDGAGGYDTTADLNTASSAFTVNATVQDRTRALLRMLYPPAFAGDFKVHTFWRDLCLYGYHGLALGANGGVLESDVQRHAIETFAPMLSVTDDSVEDSVFEIDQLTFLDAPTTAGDIVRGANRFSLRDWAVWGKRTFYSHARGAQAKRWIARVGEAELDETGPSMKQIWNGIYVSYQDVDGSTRLVGPTGSSASVTSDLLTDEDPENPANEMNMRLWDLLQAGITTQAGALELGRRFLEDAKQLDLSGRGTLRGYIESASGNLHPASVIRAGDEISFLGASDQSYRRIVRADYSRADRSCGVDLDAPPEGLSSLLARLEVSLVRLGL